MKSCRQSLRGFVLALAVMSWIEKQGQKLLRSQWAPTKKVQNHFTSNEAQNNPDGRLRRRIGITRIWMRKYPKRIQIRQQSSMYWIQITMWLLIVWTNNLIILNGLKCRVKVTIVHGKKEMEGYKWQTNTNLSTWVEHTCKYSNSDIPSEMRV